MSGGVRGGYASDVNQSDEEVQLREEDYEVEEVPSNPGVT